MNIKIIKKLTRNCMNRLIIIIPLLFLLYGQSYAQWQKTNLPSSSKVNTLAISDSSIYAGTEGDGIFVSKDNGETWNSKGFKIKSSILSLLTARQFLREQKPVHLFQQITD